ncbi:MAG: membrane protein insertion efficiency factor YidD [Bacilli bacterium]
MKKIIIMFFQFYQKIPGNFHNYCRHFPSCSEYGIISVKRFGTVKGIYLTIKRILKCNPLNNTWYDPVPERKIK